MFFLELFVMAHVRSTIALFFYMEIYISFYIDRFPSSFCVKRYWATMVKSLEILKKNVFIEDTETL